MSLDLSTNPYLDTNNNNTNTENKSLQQQKNKKKKNKNKNKNKKKKQNKQKRKQANNNNKQSNNEPNNNSNNSNDPASNHIMNKSKTLLDYYELRDRKSVNYKKPKIHNYLDPGYNTEEELKKLQILEKQYPNYNTDLHTNASDSDDCDLNQENMKQNNNNTNDKMEIDTESKNKSQTSNDITTESQPNKNAQTEIKSDTNQTQNEQKTETKQEETQSKNALDENGISSSWSYDTLMAKKPLLFNCKYRWNFCNSYFSNESLDHIYIAPFEHPTNEQIIKYENMLKECIETVTKYNTNNSNTNELMKQFEEFSNNFRIQFSDSILLFNGMNEGQTKTLTNEKGRSVRVGIFRKNNSNNNSNNKQAEMIVCYADNKQFVAECQQFFGIKINDFEYESRKWALAEDTAYTIRKNEIKIEPWMDIGLVIAISIINRLLNPSLPERHRINSIYKQQIFDVTDLLPPFDDLQSLLKNDIIWWIELDKRLNTNDTSDKVSNGSGYNDGSLKDFIDDTVVEQIDIKEELDRINERNMNEQQCDGMLSNFLMAMKEYNEENDKDYCQEEDNDNDCEDFDKFVDDKNVVGLFDENVNGKEKNNEKENKKRKLEEDVSGELVEVVDGKEPVLKKQKLNE